MSDPNSINVTSADEAARQTESVGNLLRHALPSASAEDERRLEGAVKVQFFADTGERIAFCRGFRAALASRAPAGEPVNEDDFTDDWYTEAMNLVARIAPLAYKGGASLIERLRYIAAGAAPDGRAP